MINPISSGKIALASGAIVGLLCAVTADSVRAADYGEGVIAFYPMDGQAAGTSAVGVPIVNAVEPDNWSGSVTLSADETKAPFATFDSDRPGAFIRTCEGGALICTNARSLHVGSSDAEGVGGSLSFAGLGAEISKHHANGHTVEYFYRIDGTKVSKFCHSILVEGGYLRTGMGSAAQAIRLYAPNNAMNSAIASLGYYGNQIGDNPCRADMTFSPAPNNGEWHHVAIVETNLEIRVYYDYELRGSFAFDGTKEIDSGVVEFFCGKIQGWVSCIRVTDHALDTKGFLRAGFADESGTLAFYPFKDAEAGTSAVGVEIDNVIASGYWCGTVTLNADAAINPFATFSSDSPGAYVYGGHRGGIVCRDPGSIRVGSDLLSGNSAGSGATVAFRKLGALISANRGKGCTIEYFGKVDGAKVTGYSSTVNIDGGYLKTDTGSTEQPLRLYAPLTGGSTSAVGSLNYYGNSSCRADMTFSPAPNNGEWHHIAFVETPALEIKFYYDYVQQGSFSFNGTKKVLTGDASFFCDHLQGWMSCLRVTDHVLDPDEFLFATAHPITPIKDADVAAFYTFKDGAVGSSAASVKLLNEAAPLLYNGTVDLSTSGTTNPSAVFDDDAPGSAIYGGEEYPETPFVTNVRSIACSSETDGNSAKLSVSTIKSRLFEAHATGFTIEYFFKFTDGNIAEYDPCFLVWAGYLNNSGVAGSFNVTFPVTKSNNRLNYGFGTSAAEGQMKQVTLPSSPIDGKWHHLALVETPVVVNDTVSPAVTNWHVSVWLDYRNVDSGTGYYNIANSPTVTASASGTGIEICRNKHHCKYSCLKVTTRPLNRKEFMRTRPRLRGTVIIVR